MTSRSAAGRYARALLAASLDEDEADPRRVEQELTEFADLVRQHGPLQKALVNPAIPIARKRAVVSDLVDLLNRAGELTPVVRKLLLLLADRDRLGLLPDLAAAYRDRLMQHLQIVQAEVVTAVELPEGRQQTLERSLAAASGQQVSMTTRVDPAILGGVVARIGSTVFDASVRRHLERIQDKLAES